MSREQLIPRHGGFRRLKSFQLAQLVYDVTVRFCDRYVDRRSRTHDQMVQAARSGVQRIAEGSQASATSRKMELKLTNVARASLEELRLDYEDFLRHRGLPLWPVHEPLRRELVACRPQTVEDVAAWVHEVRARCDGQHGQDGRHRRRQRDGPETCVSSLSIPSTSSISSSTATTSHAGIAANAALVLIGVATALLDRQIAAQAAAFERDGGFTERLYRVRKERRGY